MGHGRYGTSHRCCCHHRRGGRAIGMPSLAALPPWASPLVPLPASLPPFFLLLRQSRCSFPTTFNLRRGLGVEEYPATILFATFGMAVGQRLHQSAHPFSRPGKRLYVYILAAIDLNSTLNQPRAGLKYLLLGAISAACIAFRIALLYAATWRTRRHPGPDCPGWLGNPAPSASPLITQLVQGDMWTPDVYQGAPAPVVAFLSTASKGAAIVFLLIFFLPGSGFTLLHTPLWWLSLLSMVVGNLAAPVAERPQKGCWPIHPSARWVTWYWHS